MSDLSLLGEPGGSAASAVASAPVPGRRNPCHRLFGEPLADCRREQEDLRKPRLPRSLI